MNSEPVDFSVVGPPGVQGRRVALRPILRSDYEYLYRLFVDPETAFRWRLRGATPDTRSFESVLWEQVLVQFLIVAPNSGQPLGLVQCFGADLRSGVANLAIVVQKDQTERGIAAEALFLFIDYVFAPWNLRKLYADTPAFNFDRLASANNRYFTVEARLPDRHWYNDRYWDNLILAIHREQWRAVSAKFGRLIRGGCAERSVVQHAR
jgi:RimJ/RimL family protein N-acetyltransferase